jgi:hypothetical protein
VKVRIVGSAEPEPDVTRIVGTGGRDEIHGTSGDDIIESLGGRYDQMWGGDGADGFVFGAEAQNGSVDLDWIYDFDDSEDIILLRPEARLDSMTQVGGQIWIMLRGDGDQIVLEGTDLDMSAVEIETGWVG